MKQVSRAESEFEVEESLSQFDCFNRCSNKPVVHFGDCVHGCRQAKPVAVVLAGETNPTRLHQPP